MKKTLMVLLLGTALVVAPVQGYASSGKSKTNMLYVLGALSITLDVVSTAVMLYKAPHITVNLPQFDVVNEALDAAEYALNKKHKTQWKGIPPELQAQQRLIGGFEDLESYQESKGFLTDTDVHAMAVTNTGIEALYDNADVPTDPATYSTSAMTTLIQTQFGTPWIGADTEEDTSAAEALEAKKEAARKAAIEEANSQGRYATQAEIDAAVAAAIAGMSDAKGTEAMQDSLRAQYSDEDKAKQKARREIHHQKTTIGGVAKAELFQQVVATDNHKTRLKALEGYVGKGESLSGQAKIYGALELELSNRLNMLNVVQGNLLAVESANALARVK